MAKQAIILGVATILMLTSGAFAFTDEGDAVEGGSWTQGWTESGVGSFDHFQFLIHDIYGLVGHARGFEDPGISVGSGWAQTGETALIIRTGQTVVDSVIIADGPSTTSLGFSHIYASDMSTPFLMTMQAYNGNDCVDNMDAYWNGSSWAYSDPTWAEGKLIVASQAGTPAVPEPFTMATAFLVIGSFGMYVRKHSRKQAGR